MRHIRTAEHVDSDFGVRHHESGTQPSLGRERAALRQVAPVGTVKVSDPIVS